MVVCKFFAKGYCKFGNECRFEHESLQGRRNNSNDYGNNQSGQRYQESRQYFGQQQQYQQRQFGQQQQSSHQSQQHYFGQNQQSQNRQSYFGQQQSINRQSNAPDSINLEHQTYMVLVEKDSLEWEYGGQWPFSVYAPLLRRLLQNKNRNDETLPGLIDLSQEELRWEAIQAHASGQFAEYLNKLQLISASQLTIRRGLQKIDPPTARFIAGYERGDVVNPAGTLFQNISSEPSMFVNNFQHPAAVKSFSFKLPAGPASPLAASNFSFKLPSQTAFQQPAVCQQSLSSSSPLIPPQQSVFQQPFQLPIQQQQQQPSPPSSFAPYPVTIIHHPLLSTAELEQFKADKFSFGRIPRHPPPKELR